MENADPYIKKTWPAKMWSLRVMEYYSSLYRDEALTRATAWMSLEDRVTEKSHTQSPTCVTPCMRHVQNKQNRQRQIDGRLPGPVGVVFKRTWTVTALGAELLLGVMKMF